MTSLSSGVLFILGVGIFGGLLGAWLFQKLRIPQVVGYIVIGLIIGESGLRIVKTHDITALEPFNLFALGIIGFLVGGELKLDIFKKYARQFLAILIGEGIGAFLLVGTPIGFTFYFLFGSISIAAAAGVVFGAIASATDPASTIDVLWEYRARGVLTTSITAIVALDDALAMTLYGLGTSFAQMLTTQTGSIFEEMKKISFELFGAVILGVLCALLLWLLLKWLHGTDKSLAFAIGLILLLISIAHWANMDVILAAMSLGFVLTNIAPRRSEKLFIVMRTFSIPIYVLFFVLVGARLGLSQMPPWLWIIVAIYVLGRSVGKMAGAYLGAALTSSPAVVRKYLGMGLFAQGGVAIGLSIMASQHLKGIMINDSLALGDAIIFAVTATTLIVQLAGPPMVKLAIKLAKEAGRNVTEEDVIADWKAKDVIDTDIIPISEAAPLRKAVNIFVENDYLVYPVIDEQQKIVGIISLKGLKTVLEDRQVWDWLLASDVMEQILYEASLDSPLDDILQKMRELKVDQVPVVDKKETGKLLGMLDMHNINTLVEKEVINRQRPDREL